jgi:hypothetical protein
VPPAKIYIAVNQTIIFLELFIGVEMVYIKRVFWAFRNKISRIPQNAEFSKFYFSERKKDDLSTPSTPSKMYFADNQVRLSDRKLLSW